MKPDNLSPNMLDAIDHMNEHHVLYNARVVRFMTRDEKRRIPFSQRVDTETGKALIRRGIFEQVGNGYVFAKTYEAAQQEPAKAIVQSWPTLSPHGFVQTLVSETTFGVGSEPDAPRVPGVVSGFSVEGGDLSALPPAENGDTLTVEHSWNQMTSETKVVRATINPAREADAPDIEVDPLPPCFHLKLHYNEKTNTVHCSLCSERFVSLDSFVGAIYRERELRAALMDIADDTTVKMSGWSYQELARYWESHCKLLSGIAQEALRAAAASEEASDAL